MADLSLEELLRAAGASLGDAQGGLLTGIDAAPTTMAIAEATLEMKLTIDSIKGGVLQVAPVTGADARTGAINTAALSSVTMRFVPFGNDVGGQIATPKSGPAAPATPGASVPPRTTRTPVTRDDAETLLRERPDIAKRIAAGEPIRFEAIELDGGATAKSFVVTARDAQGGSIAAAMFAAKD